MRRTILAVFASIAVIGIGVTAWVASQTDDWLARSLEQAAADRLGAELTLGELDFRSDGAVVHGVRFRAGADSWIEVRAPVMVLRLDPAATLSGHAHIERAALTGAEVVVQLPPYAVPSVTDIALVALGRSQRAAQAAVLPDALRTDAAIGEVVVDGTAIVRVGESEIPVSDLHFEARDLSPQTPAALLWDSRIEGTIFEAPVLLDTRDAPVFSMQRAPLDRWDDALRGEGWVNLDAGLATVEASAAEVAVRVEGLELGVSGEAPSPVQVLMEPIVRVVRSQQGDLAITVPIQDGWRDPVQVLVDVWWGVWEYLARETVEDALEGLRARFAEWLR